MFYGWYVVGCAFVVAVWGWGLGFYGPGVYLASLHSLHGWPTTLVAAAVTLYYLCGAAWIMFVGDAIERLGPRRVVLVGCCALGSGVSLLPLAGRPWHVYPIFILMSFGWAAMSGGAINAIVAPWFDRRRGLAISLALNGSSCGGVFVTPLLVLLTSRLGFAQGVHIAVAIMLVVMAPVLLALRRRPEDMGLLPDDAPRATETGPSVASPRGPASQWSRRRAIHDRAFLTISIPFALGLAAQVGFLTHQISYLLPFFGPQAAALAVSSTTAAAVVGRTITGLFIDRVDRRLASSANFMLQMAGLGLLLLTDATPLILLGCLLFGLGVGNMITLPSLIVQREFPREDFSRVVSLVVSVNQLTFAFGPAILGGLRDWWGSYRPALLFCMILQGLAALLVLLGRRPEPGDEP